MSLPAKSRLPQGYSCWSGELDSWLLG